MSAATDIQSGAAFAPEQPKPTREDIIEMAGDMLGVICLGNDLPADFDGINLSIIKEPGTNRLQAVILSPVDMHAGEPFARYQVNPTHTPAPKTPKLLLPG